MIEIQSIIYVLLYDINFPSLATDQFVTLPDRRGCEQANLQNIHTIVLAANFSLFSHSHTSAGVLIRQHQFLPSVQWSHFPRMLNGFSHTSVFTFLRHSAADRQKITWLPKNSNFFPVPPNPVELHMRENFSLPVSRKILLFQPPCVCSSSAAKMHWMQFHSQARRRR